MPGHPPLKDLATNQFPGCTPPTTRFPGVPQPCLLTADGRGAGDLDGAFTLGSQRLERLTDHGKRRGGRCTQMVGEMVGQTDDLLPVGQAPWAPCLGEGSFSASILPCWDGLCERGDQE
jgi:hypothetical protein